ncbi:DNA-binding NarL/FixJ family response regulator [Actinokineospora baliensis]|uniref:response regulator transcription factor n=1 Tax=Actinokineospora baliensis TaxID=547056 RepID=UPI001958119D|nr:response regulator transcription factor [Actinokineospora baliensis]MBM7774708.1 DNA-binding NarL/FixJ family response regulator [Actinokineospora baliensis]
MIRIAVVDPLPLFQQGVSAVLTAAGHVVEAPVDIVTWAVKAPSAVILLTVRLEQDWDLLAELRRMAAAHAVVAVVERPSSATGVRAVRAGARSVLFRDAPAEALRHTVEATISGQAVLPPQVVTALATADGQDTVTPEQLTWLRQLATGRTVTEVAGHAGYSERAMYRLLNGLYRHMGVGSRLEAIIRARDAGWL